MPYEKEKDDSIRDLAFPANDSTLQLIQKTVIAEYEKITGQEPEASDEYGYLPSSSVSTL